MKHWLIWQHNTLPLALDPSEMSPDHKNTQQNWCRASCCPDTIWRRHFGIKWQRCKENVAVCQTGIRVSTASQPQGFKVSSSGFCLWHVHTETCPDSENNYLFRSSTTRWTIIDSLINNPDNMGKPVTWWTFETLFKVTCILWKWKLFIHL